MKTVATPRATLPPDDLATLAAEGAAMGLDEIVAYALEVDGAPPTEHDETPE